MGLFGLSEEEETRLLDKVGFHYGLAKKINREMESHAPWLPKYMAINVNDELKKLSERIDVESNKVDAQISGLVMDRGKIIEPVDLALEGILDIGIRIKAQTERLNALVEYLGLEEVHIPVSGEKTVYKKKDKA